MARSCVMPWMQATSSGIVQPSGRTMRFITLTSARVAGSMTKAANCTMCGWSGWSLGCSNSGKSVVSVS
jgi:hypothetical protein